MRKAKHGDVIKVSRTKIPGTEIDLGMDLYNHYAIYVETPDGPHAIHYTSDYNSDFKGIVRETSLEEFTQGTEYSVREFDRKKYPHVNSGEKTVELAREKIGQGKYHAIDNNCEHFAIECKTGRKDSSQTKILEFLSMPLKIFEGV